MRVAVLLVALVACKVDLDHRATPDAADMGSAGACKMGSSASCLDIAGHSDLATIQKDILTPSCAAFDTCHKGALTNEGKVDLRDGHSFATLTMMSSRWQTGRMFVVPGDLGASYVRVMLGTIKPDQAVPPDDPIPKDVGLMPQASSMLCCQKLQAVDDWISAGAPAQ